MDLDAIIAEGDREHWETPNPNSPGIVALVNTNATSSEYAAAIRKTMRANRARAARGEAMQRGMKMPGGRR